MRLRELQREESDARQAWRSAQEKLTQVELKHLRPGDGRGDGGHGNSAWREGFTVAQANEQRCWRNFQVARQHRIDGQARMVKWLSAVFATIVGLCTILQTIAAFWLG